VDEGLTLGALGKVYEHFASDLPRLESKGPCHEGNVTRVAEGGGVEPPKPCFNAPYVAHRKTSGW